MDELGGIVAEHRRLPADDTTLLGWLSALPGPVTVAMEATIYWAWLHDRLTAAGYAWRLPRVSLECSLRRGRQFSAAEARCVIQGLHKRLKKSDPTAILGSG